jgi:formylglycine-generating enzyme required for sulfatase activity
MLNGKLVIKDCDLCPEMIKIRQGSFLMGGNDDLESEKPQRSVKIKKSFYIGRYEITQKQWKFISGQLPVKMEFTKCGGDCPVENVSWNDAQEFIKRLNNKTGKRYRLPSEAEWEYSCKAGTHKKYCGSNDPELVSWFEKPEELDRSIHKVGKKLPNAWGLSDMSGNIMEWVEDCWHDNYQGGSSDGIPWIYGCHGSDLRVLRGGSWDSLVTYSRATSRYSRASNERNFRIGLRVARDVD